MRIRENNIGVDDRVFIIAEIGSNHNRDKDVAKKLIEVAADSGADAVKFQTFKGQDIPNKKIPADAYGKVDYVLGKKYWYEVLDSIKLPYEWYEELISYAHGLGLAVLATPESFSAIEFLKIQNIDAYKTASMDLTYVQLLKEISSEDKPVIISTGMATYQEIQDARACFKQNTIGILYCVSEYPLDLRNIDMNKIQHMKNTFPGDIIGFSDHCPQNLPSFVAVSTGARIIEKHITLDKRMSGPDHAFALEPSGLKDLVSGIRNVEKMICPTEKSGKAVDRVKAKLYRRSLHAVVDLDPGHTLSEEDIKIVRDESGERPCMVDTVVGKKLKKAVCADSPILLEDCE